MSRNDDTATLGPLTVDASPPDRRVRYDDPFASDGHPQIARIGADTKLTVHNSDNAHRN